MHVDIFLSLLILGSSWASFANSTETDGKLKFPVESESSDEVVGSVSKSSAIPTLVLTYIGVLKADDQELARSTVVRSISSLQPDLKLRTGKSSTLNTPTLQPALCDIQGRCYLSIEPSYNVSDKDVDTTLTPIPIVPVFKGSVETEKDKDKIPNLDTDDKFPQAINGTYVQFVRKLIPHYDFPVVPVYKSKDKTPQGYPENPTNYNKDRKVNGVGHQVRKGYPPKMFHTIGSYRPPINSGFQYRSPSNRGQYPLSVSHHQTYPHPYRQYGLRTQHNTGWTYFSVGGSRQTTASPSWGNMGHRDQGNGEPNSYGTQRGVHGLSNGNGCISRCWAAGEMEHKALSGYQQRKPSFNVSGKLEFPKEDEGATAAVRREIQVDGKLGTM